MGKIHSNFEMVKAQLETLLSALKERINALPDNPNIQRLSPNCFVISSKPPAGISPCPRRTPSNGTTAA